MYKWIINFYSASPWSLSLFTLKYWSCCVAGFDVIFSPLPGRPRRRAPSVWLINVSQATGRTSHVWKVDLIRFSPSFLWKTCQLVTVCFMIFFLLLHAGGTAAVYRRKCITLLLGYQKTEIVVSNKHLNLKIDWCFLGGKIVTVEFISKWLTRYEELEKQENIYIEKAKW